MAKIAIIAAMSEKLEPAATIIALFNGPHRVAEITGRSPSRVYRWMRAAKDGGTDGEIPSRARKRLREYALANKIPWPSETSTA